jgi:hypothetical protein
VPGQQRRTYIGKEVRVKWTLIFDAYVILQFRLYEHTTLLISSLILNKDFKMFVCQNNLIFCSTDGVSVWYVVLVNGMLLAMTLFRCPIWLVSPTVQFRNDAPRHPILVPQVARVCSELDNNLLCTSCGSTDIMHINLVVQFFNMAGRVESRYLKRSYGT